MLMQCASILIILLQPLAPVLYHSHWKKKQLYGETYTLIPKFCTHGHRSHVFLPHNPFGKYTAILGYTMIWSLVWNLTPFTMQTKHSFTSGLRPFANDRNCFFGFDDSLTFDLFFYYDIQHVTLISNEQ